MAVLASKAAARKALGGIDCGGTDLVWSIGKEGVAIFDEPAERVVPDRGNAWRRPCCEIDDLCVLGRCLASDRGRDSSQSQHRNEAHVSLPPEIRADIGFDERAPNGVWEQGSNLRSVNQAASCP